MLTNMLLLDAKLYCFIIWQSMKTSSFNRAIWWWIASVCFVSIRIWVG